jgi:hypothetical protein
MVFGQAAVAGVDQELHAGIGVEDVVDAVGFTAVWSCMRPVGLPRTTAACRGGDGGLDRVLLFLPDTNARRPGRLAFGRRTWVSVPSNLMVRPSTAAYARRSARVCNRCPDGVAKPQLASKGRIWRIAPEMVERSTP